MRLDILAGNPWSGGPGMLWWLTTGKQTLRLVCSCRNTVQVCRGDSWVAWGTSGVPCKTRSFLLLKARSMEQSSADTCQKPWGKSDEIGYLILGEVNSFRPKTWVYVGLWISEEAWTGLVSPPGMEYDQLLPLGRLKKSQYSCEWEGTSLSSESLSYPEVISLFLQYCQVLG